MFADNLLGLAHMPQARNARREKGLIVRPFMFWKQGRVRFFTHASLPVEVCSPFKALSKWASIYREEYQKEII